MFRDDYRHYRPANENDNGESTDLMLEPVRHTIRRKPVPGAKFVATIAKTPEPLLVQITSDDVEDDSNHWPKDQRTLWTPFSLRRRSIYSFTATFLIILTLIVVLHQYSTRNNGLTTTKPKNYYLWTYGPTAVFIVINSLWGQVEYRVLQLEPWRLLYNKSAPVADGVLLDYVSIWNVEALFKSIWRRHFPVTLAVSVSLILKLITAFSTGLFTTASFAVYQTTKLQLGNEFSGLHFNASAVDASVFMNSWGVQQGAFSSPLGTQDGYAFQTFYPQIDPGESIVYVSQHKYSAEVDLLIPDMQCEETNTTTSSSDPDYGVLLHTSDCRFRFSLNPTTVWPAGVVLASCQGDSATMSTYFGDGTSSPDATEYKLWTFIMLETDKYRGQPVANLLGGNLSVTYYSFIGLMCTLQYTTSRANITFTGSTQATRPIADVEIYDRVTIPALKNITGSQLLYAAYGSVYRAATDTWNIARTAEYLFLGTDAVSISNIFDLEVLKRRVTNFTNSLSAQVANEYLTASSHSFVDGNIEMNEVRLTLRFISVIVITSLLALQVVLSAVFGVLYLPYAFSPRDPASIAGLSTILANSGRFVRSLSSTGHSTSKDLARLLSGQKHGTRNQGDKFAIHAENAKATLPLLTSKIEWWRPASASTWARLLVLLLPVVIIIVLEVLCQISQRSGGIANSSKDSFVNSLPVYFPAFLMLGVRTLFEMVYFAARIFQPYHNLQKGNARPETSIMDNQHRNIAVFGVTSAIKRRQWAVVAGGISVLLGPSLAIVVSGLYSTDASSGYNVTLNQLNRLNMSDDYFYIRTGTYESAWLGDLILEFNSSYPQWTYEEFSFPKVEIAAKDLAATGFMSNDSLNGSVGGSSVTARLPGVSINIACDPIPKSDFNVSVLPDFSRYAVDEKYVISVNFTRVGGHSPMECGVYDGNVTAVFPGLSNYFNSWFHTSGDASQLDVKNPPAGCPWLIAIYGQISSTATVVQSLVALGCRPRVEQTDFEVVLSLPTYTFNLTRPPRSIPETTRVLWDVSMGSQNQSVVPNLDDMSNTYFISRNINDPSTVALDPLYRSIVHGTNPTAAADLLDPTVLARCLRRNMGILTAQLINWFGREDYAIQDTLSLETRPTFSATLAWPFRSRIVQHPISTRILQCILATMTISAAVSILLMKTIAVLPKNPLSIAAAASLLADSNILRQPIAEGMDRNTRDGHNVCIPLDSEWCTDKELVRRGIFHGKTYTMGWWAADDTVVRPISKSSENGSKGKSWMIWKRNQQHETDEGQAVLRGNENGAHEVNNQKRFFTIGVGSRIVQQSDG